MNYTNLPRHKKGVATLKIHRDVKNILLLQSGCSQDISKPFTVGPYENPSWRPVDLLLMSTYWENWEIWFFRVIWRRRISSLRPRPYLPNVCVFYTFAVLFFCLSFCNAVFDCLRRCFVDIWVLATSFSAFLRLSLNRRRRDFPHKIYEICHITRSSILILPVGRSALLFRNTAHKFPIKNYSAIKML